MNYNRVTIGGHITRDPELRYTPKGAAIAGFGLAINRNWTDEAGNKKEEVTFVDVSAFGKTAENIAKFFKKGRPILLDGRLKFEQWDDKKSGAKMSKLKVVCDHFYFCDSKSTEAAPAAPAASAAAPASPPPVAPRESPIDDDTDVPF